MADDTIPETILTTQNDATDTVATEPAKVEAVADAVAAEPLDDSTILGGDVKPADDADAGKADEPAGAPEAYTLTAPDGAAFDADAFALAEPVLRELNLTNEQAQKIVDVYPTLMQRAADEAGKSIIADVVATRKAWAETSLADAEIGGSPENHEIVKATAAKALDRFGGAEFRSFLNETGLGNHPDMIRFAYRAGKSISEDTEFHRADAAVKPKLTLEQKFYGNRAST